MCQSFSSFKTLIKCPSKILSSLINLPLSVDFGMLCCFFFYLLYLLAKYDSRHCVRQTMLTLSRAPYRVVSWSDISQKHATVTTTGFFIILLLHAGCVPCISCFYPMLVEFRNAVSG